MISKLNQQIIDMIDAGTFPVIRITNKFQLDDSIDPGFVVKIFAYKKEHHEVIKFNFVITPELYPICKEVAIPTFYDKNGKACLDWFEAKIYNTFEFDGANYKDDLYISDEENEWAQILSDFELSILITKYKNQIESEPNIKS